MKRKIIFLFIIFALAITQVLARTNIKMKTVASLESKLINVKDYSAIGDGVADDTAAIKKALNQALKINGTVYFPEGSYLLKETLNIERDDGLILTLKGEDGSRIIGDISLEDDMIRNAMKYNFYVYNLNFEHKGPKGSCLNSLFVQAINCSFTSSSSNRSPLLAFSGSDCKIKQCSFESLHPDSYSIHYSRKDDNISINNYIVDNTFSGIGMGIVVGPRSVLNERGRVEGLKINGNSFTNSGLSQIEIYEILHLDISGNELLNCSGSAVVLRCHGYGPDGIYINNNIISSDFAGIRADKENFIDNFVQAPHIANIFISNNAFEAGKYGIYSEAEVKIFNVRNNLFTNHSIAGVYLKNPTSTIITENTFDDMGYSLDISLNAEFVEGTSSIIINDNHLGNKSRIVLKGGRNIIQQYN